MNYEDAISRVAAAGLAEEAVTIDRSLRYYRDLAKAKPRTTRQNAWYRVGVLKPLSAGLGWEPPLVHEYLKRFLPDGVTSTTQLTTTEFSEFADAVIRFAAEHGVVIIDHRDAVLMESK